MHLPSWSRTRLPAPTLAAACRGCIASSSLLSRSVRTPESKWIARSMSKGQRTGIVSPRDRAPEQTLGHPVDARSDVNAGNERTIRPGARQLLGCRCARAARHLTPTGTQMRPH
jgi:hypothetical protein